MKRDAKKRLGGMSPEHQGSAARPATTKLQLRIRKVVVDTLPRATRCGSADTALR